MHPAGAIQPATACLGTAVPVFAGARMRQASTAHRAAGVSSARHAGSGGLRLHVRLHQVSDQILSILSKISLTPSRTIHRIGRTYDAECPHLILGDTFA